MDPRAIQGGGNGVPILGQPKPIEVPIWPVYLVWDDGAEAVQIGTTMHGPLLQRGDVREFDVSRAGESSTVTVEVDRVVHRTCRYGPSGLFLVGHRVIPDPSVDAVVSRARPRG